METLNISISTGSDYTIRDGEICLRKIGDIVIASSTLVFMDLTANKAVMLNATIPEHYRPSAPAQINGQAFASGRIDGGFRITLETDGTIAISTNVSGQKEYRGNCCYAI